MPTSKPGREVDTLAAIIPFRPRRSQMAKHPSVRSQKPRPPTAANEQGTLPRPAPKQLSLFDAGTGS